MAPLEGLPGDSLCWTDETKVEMFGHSAQRHTVVEGWSFRPGHLAVIDLTTNSSLYQSIIDSNIWPSVQQLDLTWVEQQDNDAKHSSKSIAQWPWHKSVFANLNELNVVKKSGPKRLRKDVRNSWSHTKHLCHVIAAESVSTSYWIMWGCT